MSIDVYLAISDPEPRPDAPFEINRDPCDTQVDRSTAEAGTTVVGESGTRSVVHASVRAGSRFDCFYIYPTVSRELASNADRRVQRTEIAAAVAQAARFSTVCRVWSPIYRQVTLAGLAAAPGLAVPAAETATAYASLQAGFEDYLTHFNDGRPIVFIGHSQGAAMLILLLRRLVDGFPALRRHLVLAIVLGGNVVVRSGSLTGGSFAHLALCDRAGESGCVIAYSSFPGQPPTAALVGRPGQGVSLQSGQTGRRGLQVACVNPAAPGGRRGVLDPYFPAAGAATTPWVAYPGRYTARCRHADGAGWLEVSRTSGAADRRPVVTEQQGPDWGFHADDVNLALGNLVADVAAAEASWSRPS